MPEPEVNDQESQAALVAGSKEEDSNPTGSFFVELRERKVYQTTGIYVAAAWAVIQFADVVAPILGMPDWSISLLFWILIAALPVVIILSWMFEIRSHESATLSPGLVRFFSSARFVILWTVAAIVMVVLTTVLFGSAPRPSFALAPKDSVLVGRFQNYTNNGLLDSSLELALRVAFEQSQHAVVIPEARVQQTMAQMLLDDDAEIEKDVAIQLALREQASALVVGSIGEVGSTYKLSVEVIDPSDGRTVLLETANAESEDTILETLDDLTRNVRSSLGESVADISRTTPELDRVTTADLEALKAYSLGIRAAGRGDVDDAVDLLQRAIDLDSEFSMAHAKLATLYESALRDPAAAARHRALALEFSDRLTERERLYVKASQTRNDVPAEKIRAWRLMRTVFPEEAVGHHNLATIYWRFENDFPAAAESYAAAAAIDNPWRHLSLHYLGSVYLGLKDFDAAFESFRRAHDLQAFPIDGGFADAYIADYQHQAALDFISTAREGANEIVQFELEQRLVDIAIDQGQLAEALLLGDVAMQRAQILQNRALEYRARAMRLAVLERSASSLFNTELEAAIASLIPTLEKSESGQAFSPLDHLLVLGKIAARNGRGDLARMVLAQVEPAASDSGFFFRDRYLVILRAEVALAAGNAGEAVDILLEGQPDRPFFQFHESLARAYAAAGQLPEALQEYRWLQENRGLALAEAVDGLFQRQFSLLDTATASFHRGRLHERLGEPGKAVDFYAEFLGRWSGADQELPIVSLARDRQAALSP